MIISIIVAVSENDVIGKDNTLIWHLPADMKYFKEKTSGYCIITGRKNYESLPEKFRPLPNRTNIVITRQKDYDAPGAIVVSSLEIAIQKAKEIETNEIFIIGGGEIFNQSLPMTDRIYLTKIHEHFQGDVYFPKLNSDEWEEVDRQDHQIDEKNKYPYSFITLNRIS